MDEHRLIERVIDALVGFVARLTEGESGPGARRAVADFATFFREFADRCHHGREEDQLFVRMCEHGFSREQGPLRVMLHEHELGREHVRALTTIGAGEGNLSEEERWQVRERASGFAPLLRAHIQKEDQILYPAAKRALPPEVMESLADAFEAFERETIGEGGVARLHQIAEQLVGSYGSVS